MQSSFATQANDHLPMKDAITSRGWSARLNLEYRLRGDKTRLVRREQSGPLTVQRSFYPEGNTCHNYILHPPGGVVGRDSLEIDVVVDEQAHCLLTTPGATKFYRSSTENIATQTQRLSVAAGACLEWLPLQNIFFDNSHVAISTDINIDPGAKFFGWEMHCFGRPASSEPFTRGAVRSQTRVNIAGELRLAEQFNTNGSDTLLASTGLQGLTMQGSVIAAPCDERLREIVEQILQSETGERYPHPYGLTLVDEVLILRALGAQAEPMQELFTQVWMAVRQHWLHKTASAPRIWAT